MEATGYEKYGISKALVEQVKLKLKKPHIKEQVAEVMEDVSKQDLQKQEKIKSLIRQVSRITGTPVDTSQTKHITQFVISQKIDPKNTFHLIKLWNMFR